MVTHKLKLYFTKPTSERYQQLNNTKKLKNLGRSPGVFQDYSWNQSFKDTACVCLAYYNSKLNNTNLNHMGATAGMIHHKSNVKSTGVF